MAQSACAASPRESPYATSDSRLVSPARAAPMRHVQDATVSVRQLLESAAAGSRIGASYSASNSCGWLPLPCLR